MLQYFGSDRSAGNCRLPERDVIAADHQHLAELDDFTGISLDFVYPDDVLGSYAVLFSAGSYDCEHGFVLGSIRRSGRWTRFPVVCDFAVLPALTGMRNPHDPRPLPLGGDQRLKTQVGRG